MPFLLICILSAIGIWLFILLVGAVSKRFSISHKFELEHQIDFESVENRLLLVDILINQNEKISPKEINEVIEIYFPKISKKRPLVLFTLGSNSDQFAKAIIQGEDEKYKVELKPKENVFELCLEYEAESLWKKGCQRFIWSSIAKDFQQKAQIISSQLIIVSSKSEAKENLEPEAEIEVFEENEIRIVATSYVDIPVGDLARAKWFYAGVFGFEFIDEARDEYWVSHFKYANGEFIGTLTFCSGYVPQALGVDIFIPVREPWLAQSLIHNYGGKVLIEYKNVNGNSIVKFLDSEGNRLGIIS